jgi:2-oxoisovalerate dehydrogenase E2 component (dihydrolipoyl transacylase)
LDINKIKGTGKGGRVTKEDAIRFMESSQSKPVAEKETPRVQGNDKVKKIVGIQKAMTKTMTDSLSIPTFTFSDDMDATKLIRLRSELKNNIDGLTFMPFFIKAISLAMNEFPIINSVVDPSLDAEGYIKQYTIKGDHNFSIAIDSKDGLTTPNIKHVNRKSILDLNGDLRNLIEKVQTNSLQKSDFEDGTFSVSSVGNIGGKYFVPTILRPQAAIIAIGKAYKQPKYTGSGNNHTWEPMDTISFSITADHRILDGATVARFSQSMKKYIENPNLMLISI